MPSGIFDLLNTSTGSCPALFPDFGTFADPPAPSFNDSEVIEDNAMDVDEQELEVGTFPHLSLDPSPSSMAYHADPSIWQVPRPKVVKRKVARGKGPRIKGGSLYSVNSAASSPGPSTLAGELELDEHSEGTAWSGEGTRENSPHRPPNEISIDGKEDQGSVVASVVPRPKKPVEWKDLDFLPALQTAFNNRRTNVSAFDNYVPFKRVDIDEEERMRRGRGKGKGKAKVEEQEVTNEEGDERLHCICQLVYDADVCPSPHVIGICGIV